MEKAGGIITVLFAMLVLAGCFSHSIEDGKQLKETSEAEGLSEEVQIDELHSKKLDKEEGVDAKTGGKELYETTPGDLKTNISIPQEFPENIPIPQDGEIKEALKVPKAGGEIISLHYFIPGQKGKQYNELYVKFLEDEGSDVQLEAESEHFYQVSGNLAEGNNLHVTVVEDKELTNVLLIYGELHRE